MAATSRVPNRTRPIFDLRSPARAQLPFAPSASADAQPAQAVADPRAPIELIMFGHIGPNRQVEQVLEALALVDRPHRFRLQVLGQIWDRVLLEQRIRELHLDGVVSLPGYVTDAALDSALTNADLAINLRYPTLGEASISQLHFSALQADPEQYRRLGLAGRRWVHAQHSITAYVESLLISPETPVR